MLIYRGICIVASNVLLCHVHALTVLKNFVHDMRHLVVVAAVAGLYIKLRQEVVLVEVHHFLEDFSFIDLFDH
jgi:hypothetical protein